MRASDCERMTGYPEVILLAWEIGAPCKLVLVPICQVTASTRYVDTSWIIQPSNSPRATESDGLLEWDDLFNPALPWAKLFLPRPH
jgi:hypothetical protein